MKRIYLYIPLLLILLAASCRNDHDPASPDSFEEGIPAVVNISLSSRFNMSETRAADGTPMSPVYDNEKIRDWFVVFIDKNGKVAKIISRSDAETGIDVSSEDAFEQESFRCILPSGSYSAYAFANLTREELKADAGLEFNEGNSAPADIEAKTLSTNLNGWNITAKGIPMTGFKKDIVIKNTIEETLSIEVVRMAAKVEFLLSNPTDRDITVSGISFDPVTVSPVSLFPRGASGVSYNHLGAESYAPLSGAMYAHLQILTEDIVAKGEQDKSSAFYITETVSNRYNDKAFTVGLKVTHNDGISEHQQYNITKYIKGYINRNDWIIIPITLSQYDVEVEALFYPPIGGYPAVLSSIDPDGSQIFTFGSEGEFSIVPHVFDKVTGTHLAPSDYTILSVTTSGMSFIFSQKPTITETATSLPDEITGKFSTGGARGVASVEIKIEIGTQIYTRIIYIIRN